LARSRGLPLVLELGNLSLAGTPRQFELGRLALPYKYTTSSKKTPALLAKAKNLALRFNIRLSRGSFVSKEVGFDHTLDNTEFIRSVKGYFQSYRYVQPFQNQLQLFVKTLWTEKLKLKATEVNPIVMHIRRGDYLEGNESIGVLSINYFRNALNVLSESGIHGPVWVFTDSPELIDSKFLIEINGELISAPSGTLAAEIMSVMSLGRGIIISNSTFSWWAAYLNKNSMVIAPDKWFRAIPNPKDLYPENWVLVRSDWQ
jgi:hypothetical protein